MERTRAQAERTENVNKNTAIFIVDDRVRGIEASYENDGKSEMFKAMDPSIQVGDFVTIPTSTRHHMTVVKVTAVDVDPPMDHSTGIPWIIGTVDTKDFSALVEEEERIVGDVMRRQRLRERQKARREFLGEDDAVLQVVINGNQGGDEDTIA